MELSQFFAFLSASIILTLAPGPDILYLLSTSLSSGWRSGAMLALGLCSGLIFHTFLVACGVAAIIQASPFLFSLLKYAGAGYLLYLAYGSLNARGSLPLAASIAPNPRGSLYRRGLVMNILNPKVLIFFLAFLPQFIDSRRGDVTGQILLLGFIFGLQAYSIFLALSFLSKFVRKKILTLPNFPRLMNRIQATTLLAISLLLLFS